MCAAAEHHVLMRNPSLVKLLAFHVVEALIIRYAFHVLDRRLAAYAAR